MEQQTVAQQTLANSMSRRPRRWRLVLGVGLALLLVIGGAGAFFLRAELDPGAPVAGVSEVAVRDIEFGPAAVEVPVGTTVTWRWQGVEEHNVVGEGFESPVRTEGVFDHRFAEAGTYPYQCTLHVLMRGEVVVVE